MWARGHARRSSGSGRELGSRQDASEDTGSDPRGDPVASGGRRSGGCSNPVPLCLPYPIDFLDATRPFAGFRFPPSPWKKAAGRRRVLATMEGASAFAQTTCRLRSFEGKDLAV